MTALDTYDCLPREMRTYLSHNGWHFNKRAVQYAARRMRRKNPTTGKMERVEPLDKDAVDAIMTAQGVRLERAVGLDYVYVANMAKADFWKSSIEDDKHLALLVKDIVDDPDAADGHVMRRWYADMVGLGEPVEWDEIL